MKNLKYRKFFEKIIKNNIKILIMSFKINLFYPILVILLLITLIKPQIPNPEESNPPSHVHNESEYYNDSIFEDMNIEDETPTEADNKEDNKDEEEEDEDDKNIMKEWEEYMHDFVPADMLTYEIEGFQREVHIKFDKI